MKTTHYYSLFSLHLKNSGHIQHDKSKYSINFKNKHMHFNLVNKQTNQANNHTTRIIYK